MYVRVWGSCASMNSYIVSQRLCTINYELLRPLVHHNSKNTASATKVVWRGYWPLLFFLVTKIFNMSTFLCHNFAPPKTNQLDTQTTSQRDTNILLGTFVLNSSCSPPFKFSLNNFHKQKSHPATIVTKLLYYEFVQCARAMK